MSYSNDNSSITNQLPLTIDIKEEDIWDSFSNAYKKIANSVNSKEGGLYIQNETATSAQYFTQNNPQVYRNVYRVTVDFGNLPNATTKSVAHNIGFTNQYVATRIYGGATRQGPFHYLPLPFPSATANNVIEVSVDATNVTITTGIDRSNYIATIVIEYLKNS
jgi:hypothetical protein